MPPLRDIPNFSAAFGKSPRSTIPNDKFLFEYVIESSGKHRLACMQAEEHKARNSTNQNLDVFPSVSKVSNCSGVSLLDVPSPSKAGGCVTRYITENTTMYQRAKW